MSNYYRFSLKGIVFFAIFLLLHTSISFGQISYGGKPLALNYATRSSQAINDDFFIDMPRFDENAEFRAQANNAKFKSLYFAHKFYVHLRPENSGVRFATNEGMTVWRVGIRSRHAYSLNILFTRFHIPEGARVFVYNSDQSEILGSYTSQNNTDYKMLPIQPISGDKLIVEYQEPDNASFKGEIEIGEVNHDFTNIFRAGLEPRDPVQSCHPNVVCYPEDVKAGSGVVGLIINGNTFCTGSIVNNTSQDGTPYLLTATHCLNSNYDADFIANSKYQVVASNIVAFFNYQSPVCPTDIRGNVQMSMASADSVLISEKHDISLLKLKQKPPKEYMPIYLGWNVSSNPTAPFHGIHHPNGGIKKVAIDNDALTIGSFDNPRFNMEPNVHWVVKAWDTGSTEGGSSGSPLLDTQKRILGTLTGGESYCTGNRGPDVYAALYKFWTVQGSLRNSNSIKHYLDPKNSGFLTCDPYNPYTDDNIQRKNNFDTSEKVINTLYNNGTFLFETNSSLGYTEFAEEFNAGENTKLYGVFISTPAIDKMELKDIRIKIYSGKDAPSTLIHEQKFTYGFKYNQGGQFYTDPRDMNYKTENFVAFSSPVSVNGKYYISYSDANVTTPGFSVLNAEPRKTGASLTSTAWMKNAKGWIPSSQNVEKPINTSLLISPLYIGSNPPVNPTEPDLEVSVSYSSEVKRLFVNSNKDIVSWEIFNTLGQRMHAAILNNSANRISYDSAHLSTGVYIVRVVTSAGKSNPIKVLVH